MHRTGSGWERLGLKENNHRQKRAAKAENEQYIAELLREERMGKGGNA